MYAAPDNRIGEANSARRYQELYHNLITKPNQLLVPIIMFLDGTAIDSKGHIELCPVSLQFFPEDFAKQPIFLRKL